MEIKRLKGPNWIGYSLAALMLVLPHLTKAEIVVIANKSLPIESISPQQTAKLWLGIIDSVESSGKLKVVDALHTTPVYTEFYEQIAGKSVRDLRIYWGKLLFSGKAFPPKRLGSDREILHWVMSTPNGLGYINAEFVDDTVNILLRQ